MKLSENVLKDPINVVHSENINYALQYMTNIPHDVAIITGDNEEIQTNKLVLSVFSPILRNLLSSPLSLDTSRIIFLPFSTSLKVVEDQSGSTNTFYLVVVASLHLTFRGFPHLQK